MTPEQIRTCRTGMRLSQPAFGDRIGVGRFSINHYENGRRHDTKRSIEISKTTDMACGAAWLAIDGYTAILGAAARADSQIADCPPALPNNAVEPWIVEAALQELAKRGFILSENHLAFPLLDTLAVWSQITQWCSERGIGVRNFHPVISASVPGVAILEFATANDALNFKMFCTGGK